jgi:hypothetical protein
MVLVTGGGAVVGGDVVDSGDGMGTLVVGGIVVDDVPFVGGFDAFVALRTG